MIAKLASKQELKEGLMGYFEVNEDMGDMYLVEVFEEDMNSCFDLNDMDKIDEKKVENIVDFIFKYYVADFGK